MGPRIVLHDFHLRPTERNSRPFTLEILKWWLSCKLLLQKSLQGHEYELVLRERRSNPRNSSWGPNGMWDVEAPVLSIQWAHTVGGEVVSLTHSLPFNFKECLVVLPVSGWKDLRTTTRLEGWRQRKQVHYLIRNRTRDLPACNTLLQLTTPPNL
jgi:hypothetical protein